MTKDMTVGSPFKTIIHFSVPMLIGGIFQQFYNITDTVIIGRFVGSRALASIGASSSTMFLFLSFAIGFTNAFSIVIGQLNKKKNEAMLKITFINSIYNFIYFHNSFNICIYFFKTFNDIIKDSVRYYG